MLRFFRDNPLKTVLITCLVLWLDVGKCDDEGVVASPSGNKTVTALPKAVWQ